VPPKLENQTPPTADTYRRYLAAYIAELILIIPVIWLRICAPCSHVSGNLLCMFVVDGSYSLSKPRLSTFLNRSIHPDFCCQLLVHASI
jgi:hypothetical protein